MQATATTPEEYIENLPEERRAPMQQLRETIRQHLPAGFEERIIYGMLGYVVPFSTYPAGYHCDTSLPLSFLSIASQKNFIAVYHMGIYSDESLFKWFTDEYPKHSKRKLDMGKSCIRFKKMEEIPYELIGELATKMTPEEWVTLCERILKKGK